MITSLSKLCLGGSYFKLSYIKLTLLAVNGDNHRQLVLWCLVPGQPLWLQTTHLICPSLWQIFPISAGGSIPGQDEDISPYATFHLLGMREEAKNGMMQNGQNFQTMPSTPGNGPMTNPSTPAHQRQQPMSQTMNVRIVLISSTQCSSIVWECWIIIKACMLKSVSKISFASKLT